MTLNPSVRGLRHSPDLLSGSEDQSPAAQSFVIRVICRNIFWIELSRRTHADGLPSLGDLLNRIATPQISEGLHLVMDGTNLDLVWDLVETRQMKVLYPREETLQTGKKTEEMASFLRKGARSQFEREREEALRY